MKGMGQKVGVTTLPTAVLRRSHRLLEKNSEGNRLIPATRCAEARQNARISMSLGDSRSSTGTVCPPRRASPSLSLRTRQSINIPTASASPTFSGPPLHQGPQLSSLPPLSGSWLPCVATSGPGTTGGVGNATTNLSRPSPGKGFQGKSNQAGPAPCHLSQTPPLKFPQLCQGPDGIGHPMVAGQGPRSVPQPFPTCVAGHPCCCRRAGPWCPAAPLPRFSAQQLPASWLVLVWNAGVWNIGFGHLPSLSSHLL